MERSSAVIIVFFKFPNGSGHLSGKQRNSTTRFLCSIIPLNINLVTYHDLFFFFRYCRSVILHSAMNGSCSNQVAPQFWFGLAHDPIRNSRPRRDKTKPTGQGPQFTYVWRSQMILNDYPMLCNIYPVLPEKLFGMDFTGLVLPSEDVRLEH